MLALRWKVTVGVFDLHSIVWKVEHRTMHEAPALCCRSTPVNKLLMITVLLQENPRASRFALLQGIA